MTVAVLYECCACGAVQPASDLITIGTPEGVKWFCRDLSTCPAEIEP